MKLFAPFHKVFKIIIVVWDFAKIEVLVEGLSQIKHLTVFSFIFLQISTIDHCKLWELCYRSLSDISVSELISDRVMSNIEVFNRIDFG
jgi:hypothetical protein